MELTVIGILVGALASAISAMTYVVKKTTSFGEKALNKFDQVSDSVDKLADSNVKLAGEIRETNTLVSDHVRDSEKHLKLGDRQTLDTLGG